MALYVPAGRRKRNFILGLVGALIVGVIIGGVIGRASAPTTSDKVASVQDSAREVIARLHATPIEYGQQLDDDAEFESGGTVLDSLTEAQQSLQSTLDDAVWIGPAQRAAMEDALAAVIDAARDKVDATRYEELVDEAATTIESGFGVDAGT